MKYIKTNVPEPAPVPPLTHTIEITQEELDFIVSASHAFGKQGFNLIGAGDFFNGQEHEVISEYKEVAFRLADELLTVRTHSPVFRKIGK